MSYDIMLCVPGTEHNGDEETDESYPVAVSVDRHREGGTYCIGGTTDADLNVTYNYGRFFPWRSLHDKTGAETEPILRAACAELGTEIDPDYWKPTPGNAGYALSILLGWAERYPEGVWRVR